jgi:hypothetical protein
MRIFCGMGWEKIAAAIKVSAPTIQRDGQRAAAFLLDFHAL